MNRFSLLLVMIVFILLLLILAGIVYFFFIRHEPTYENFSGISAKDNIYIGFKMYYSQIDVDINATSQIYGYKPYNYVNNTFVGQNWDGNWLSNTGWNLVGGTKQSGPSLLNEFQPLQNYPNELNKLKRLAPSYNFNNNDILLCKYTGNDLTRTFQNRMNAYGTPTSFLYTIKPNTFMEAVDNPYKMDNKFVYTHVATQIWGINPPKDIRYLLIATEWFIPSDININIRDSIVPSMFGNKTQYSMNVNYYPLPPSNMEKCNKTAQNIALKLRKDYKIMDGNPLQLVDLSGTALSNEDKTAINADCSSNIIDGEYLITRDISNAIIKCSNTLNTLKKGGIKYGNMVKLTDCQYLQITDLSDTDKLLETNTGDTLGNLPTAALNISYTNTDNGIEFTFTNKSSLYNIGGSDSFYYVLNILSPNTDISGQISFIVNSGKSAFPLILNIDNNNKLGILSGEIKAIPNSSLTKIFSDNFTIYNTPFIFTISTYPHISLIDTTQNNTQITNIDYNSIPYTLYKSGVIDTINAPITSNIDSSLFDGACEPDTKRSKDVEYCDAPANQIDTTNKPFKLMKVQKLVTPTSIKCTKPRLIIQDFTNYVPQAAREIQYIQKQAHLQQRNILF